MNARYQVTATITVYADSPERAQELAGAAMQHYDLDAGEFRIDGCGIPSGYVSVEEAPHA